MLPRVNRLYAIMKEVKRIDCISHIEQEHILMLELCNERNERVCGFRVRLGNEAYEQADYLI